MDARRVTVPELAAVAAAGRAHEEFSAATGLAVTVVASGDVTPDEVAVLAPHVASLPCVLVAEPGADASLVAPIVDVVAPDDDVVAAIIEQAERTPLAAVALALLLRGGGGRTIDEGLVAESVTYSMLQGGPEFATWRRNRPRRLHDEPVGVPVVAVELDGPTVHITLNRPHVHNAFSRAMRDELVEALALAADPGVTTVVLDGAGPSFCSGGDLDEFGSFPDPATAHAVRLTRSPARLLAGLAAKVEVHVHGACMGAGVELPAFAHRVVAAPDARIALPELGLGLVPGAGGTVSLPRRIGRHRTALLALSGLQLDAATALEWGLVDSVSAAPGWPRRSDRAAGA